MPRAKISDIEAPQPSGKARLSDLTTEAQQAPASSGSAPTMLQNFQQAFDELATPPKFDPSSLGGGLSTGAQAFGSGVFGLAAPLVHPVQTMNALGNLIHPPINSKFGEPEMNAVKPLIQAFKENPVGQGIAALPGLLTMRAAPGGEAAVADTGAAVERGGLGLGNAAMGARGARDFQYGLNPARGAYESGALPAMSKHGTSMTLGEKTPLLGEDIANTVTGGSPVPLEKIAASVDSPLSEASAVANGPGIGGLSDTQIDAVRESMKRQAPGATSPVYGPGAGTPFTSDEAVKAILARGQKLLSAPKEDIPLARLPDVEGRLSEPVRLTQVDRPGRLLLQPPSVSTPMASGMQEEFPERLASGATEIRPANLGSHSGMGQAQYIGEIPGERGGPGQITGVLRRMTEYPESEQPSGLTDLRHPTASPSDLWRTIQNIDEKTRFRQNVTPEIENANELQKGIRHNLRGNLEEAAPGLKEQSGRYADMKAAQNVLDRTIHTDTGLNKLLQIPSYPIETTLGRGMYETGRGMQAAAPAARIGMSAAPVATLMNLLRQKEKQ